MKFTETLWVDPIWSGDVPAMPPRQMLKEAIERFGSEEEIRSLLVESVGIERCYRVTDRCWSDILRCLPLDQLIEEAVGYALQVGTPEARGLYLDRDFLACLPWED